MVNKSEATSFAMVCLKQSSTPLNMATSPGFGLGAVCTRTYARWVEHVANTRTAYLDRIEWMSSDHGQRTAHTTCDEIRQRICSFAHRVNKLFTS
jgi:hypothetical protein